MDDEDVEREMLQAWQRYVRNASVNCIQALEERSSHWMKEMRPLVLIFSSEGMCLL